VLDSIADWLGVVLVHHGKPVVACILLLHRIYGTLIAEARKKKSSQACARQRDFNNTYHGAIRAREYGESGPQRAHGRTVACSSLDVAPFFAGISQRVSKAVDLKHGPLSASGIS